MTSVILRPDRSASAIAVLNGSKACGGSPLAAPSGAFDGSNVRPLAASLLSMSTAIAAAPTTAPTWRAAL